eukprot:15062038-Alexandrium_andersonii.AAC.1
MCIRDRPLHCVCAFWGLVLIAGVPGWTVQVDNLSSAGGWEDDIKVVLLHRPPFIATGDQP